MKLKTPMKMCTVTPGKNLTRLGRGDSSAQAFESWLRSRFPMRGGGLVYALWQNESSASRGEVDWRRAA